MQLAGKSRVPHGGWRYTQPESGMEIVGGHYKDLMRKVAAHRRANGYPVGTDLEAAVGRAICESLSVEARASFCKEEDLPSLSYQLSNLGVSVARNISAVSKGHALVGTNETVERRLAICRGCEFYRASDARCSKCGCRLRYKTALRAERCPVGKW